MKNNGMLVAVPMAAEILGISGEEVQSLITAGVLLGVVIGPKVYVTKPSLAVMLGISLDNLHFPENKHGYPDAEELSSLLTKDGQEVGDDMARTGSISELSDGRFMVQINLGKSADGKRQRESKSFKDREEAQAYLDKRIQELNQEEQQISLQTAPVVTPIPQVQTVSQGYSKLTFETYAYQKLSGGIGTATSRTIEGYRGGVQRILPYIGKICISQLNKQDIINALQELTYQYADSSIQKTYRVVKMLIIEAFEEGDIPKNVMSRVKCPKSKVPQDKEEYAIFSDEEIAFLLETAKQHNKKLYTIFAVLSCTGMRPGELRSLERTDFDPVEKTIKIKQAATKKYDKIDTLDKSAHYSSLLSVTKSKYSVRTLQLTDLAVEALNDWIAHISKSRNKFMAESPFIFPDRKGGFTTDDAIKNLVARYKVKYSLQDEDLHLYKFRHTMCTKWILAGLPLAVIQQLMGDNSMKVITEIYTHIDKQMALKVAQPFYDELNKQFENII